MTKKHLQAQPTAPSKVRVTRPLMPSRERFDGYLDEIWQSAMLTNGGPFHDRLEAALRAHLNVEHLALFSSGTTALLVAMKALGVNGEVVTTPYTFAATTHAVHWSGLTPVFADIDPLTMNLDPACIEALLTPRTGAILPVHCYGVPCAVDAIGDIARRHGLPVIYDAAHAFGVEDAGGSILRHGDMSILSFHATKVFSTMEGGAIICRDAAMLERVKLMRNFGIVDESTVAAVGINGKLNEISAAFGLAQLEEVERARQRRKRIDAMYRAALSDIPGLVLLQRPEAGVQNFGYFPVFFDDAHLLGRDRLYAALRSEGIHARRYFHPLTSDYPIYRDCPSASPYKLPVAQKAARTVICLPIYADLEDNDVLKVIDVILKNALGISDQGG